MMQLALKVRCHEEELDLEEEQELNERDQKLQMQWQRQRQLRRRRRRQQRRQLLRRRQVDVVFPIGWRTQHHSGYQEQQDLNLNQDLVNSCFSNYYYFHC